VCETITEKELYSITNIVLISSSREPYTCGKQNKNLLEGELLLSARWETLKLEQIFAQARDSARKAFRLMKGISRKAQCGEKTIQTSKHCVTSES